ncbi:MAG: repeat containing protein [Acidimicrobiales bacterium]|nr:repeat containing protein [Acidimicrobiales bacterium]
MLRWSNGRNGPLATMKTRITFRPALCALLAVSTSSAGVTILAQVEPVAAAIGDITTVGGAGSGDGRLATLVGLDTVDGVAVDLNGNVYVAERFEHRVRMINGATGVISTIAGTGVSGGAGDNGQAVNATLVGPIGLAYGANDNSLYIGDGNVIRRVDLTTGIITHFAGNGGAIDGGAAATARFQDISALAVDATGDVFVADHIDNRVREISGGIVSTVIGSPVVDVNVKGVVGNTGDAGPATAATLNDPQGIAVDAAGNLYVSDTGNKRVRRVDVNTHTIDAFAGGGGLLLGDGGAAVNARLDTPTELVVVGASVLIADPSESRIRAVAAGIITTYAGTGAQTASGDGGPAAQAAFAYPKRVTADATGTVFVGDYSAGQVRRLAAAAPHVTTTSGGDNAVKYAGNGAAATAALLGAPSDVITLSNGDIVFSDRQANVLRRISAANGTISILAGTGHAGFSGDGGPATAAQLSSPGGLAVDGNDSIYAADVQNARVRKIDANGIISTIVGTGSFSHSGDGGPATAASLQWMSGIVMTSTGDLLVVENGTRVRKIDNTTGIITTIAGTGINGAAGDNGPAASASFSYAIAVAVDAADDIYVLDVNARNVRRIDAVSGVITTIAGTGGYGSAGDGGPALAATFTHPVDLVVDGAGNIFIADDTGQTVRRIDAATKKISTLAGTGVGGFGGDNGPGPAARVLYPSGVNVDRFGNVLLADSGNQRIRKIDTVAVPFVPPTPPVPVALPPVTVPPATVPPADPPPVTVPATIPVVDPVVPHFQPVQPERLLDTRSGIGAPAQPVGAGSTLVLQVTGAGSTKVPADANAVVLNITATDATADGFVTAWPCGQPQPATSSLNVTAGLTGPNLTITKVGDNGTICLFSQRSLDLIADLDGWFPAGSAYTPVQPERLLDTRDGTRAPAQPLIGGDMLVLHVTGAGTTNVPADATAAVLNITATNASAAGYVTVWPCGQPRPTASNINIAAGRTVPNLTITKLGEGGTICLFSQHTLDLVADIDGWFPAATDFVSVQPERLLDTRSSTVSPAHTVAAGSTIVLQVTGAGATNVPSTANAAVLNITATNAQASGFVTVWPCGQPQPTASNLNVAAGQTVPNLTITKLGDNGTICLFSQQALDLVADVSGWFAG